MLGWGFMNFYYSSRILMFQLFDSLTQINQIKLEFTHLKDGIQRYLDYIHICLLTFCIVVEAKWYCDEEGSFKIHETIAINVLHLCCWYLELFVSLVSSQRSDHLKLLSSFWYVAVMERPLLVRQYIKGSIRNRWSSDVVVALLGILWSVRKPMPCMSVRMDTPTHWVFLDKC